MSLSQWDLLTNNLFKTLPSSLALFEDMNLSYFFYLVLLLQYYYFMMMMMYILCFMFAFSHWNTSSLKARILPVLLNPLPRKVPHTLEICWMNEWNREATLTDTETPELWLQLRQGRSGLCSSAYQGLMNEFPWACEAVPLFQKTSLENTYFLRFHRST